MHDGEDTPPASPRASSDHSSRSLLLAPFGKVGLCPAMNRPEGLCVNFDHITKAKESDLLAFLSLQKRTDVGKREECQYVHGYLHGERRVPNIEARYERNSVFDTGRQEINL